MSAEYFKVNTKIIDDYGSALPAPVIQAYVGFLRYADNRGVVYEEKTQTHWAQAIGIGRTTLQRAIKILSEEGLLEEMKPKNSMGFSTFIVKDPEHAKPPRKRRVFVPYAEGIKNDI